MMSLAALISSCRTIASDGATDNFMRAENVNDAEFGFPIDGANTTFVVKNFPIPVGGIVKVVADNAVTTAYTPIEPVGELDLATAPISSCYVSYYFYLFPDSVWTEFVIAGLEALNYSTENGPTVDVLNVPNGLLAALKSFINSYFCRRVAQQTGLWYNQRLQERIEDRDNISNKWLKLAESSQKAGIAQVESFYVGSGAQSSPSFRIGGYQPRPYVPTR